MTESPIDDPFRRLSYRRLIAWPDRIEREWPFFEPWIEAAPKKSLIDLGCGTGEHCRFLASKGVRAVGIDRSSAQIEQAREFEGAFGPSGPDFLEGEIAALPRLTTERFGSALCLGNVFPYLEDEPLKSGLKALATALLPGAPLVVQLINYQRIFEHGIRHLPINVRPAPEGEPGEIVWVRLMTRVGKNQIMFHPTTLRLVPGEDPPVVVHAAREVLLRAWLWSELEPLLAEAGFSEFECFGDMLRAPFKPSQSHDLIFVAKRI